MKKKLARNSIDFPPELYEWLKTEAVKQRRSMTAQVVWLLEQSMKEQQQKKEKEGNPSWISTR